MALYSLLLLVALVVGAPFWLFRMATSGRYRSGLRQRLGAVPGELRGKIGGRPVVWLHAVSVGEVLAAGELVRGLEARLPGFAVALSTTTEAGQRLAKQRFPELAVFYLPLDFRLLVRRYLRVLRPRLLLLMESEFWPNLLRESKRAGAVIAVANARISDRSYPRYLRLRRLWRPILAPVSLFLAQGEETADRLRGIGVPAEKIAVTGNLKYDVRPAARGEIFKRLRAALPAAAPVLVAGSTLEGEEAQLLTGWAEVRRELPEAVLVIAPRHPPRFGTVAALVEQRGLRLHRASALSEGVSFTGGDAVLLDTIGDLPGVYELGTAAFVGGSLVPAGGHNPLEPARFGVPVLTGPSVANFREVVSALQRSDGIRVMAAGEALGAVLLEMLRSGPAVRAMGERGRAVFASEAGATARCVEAIAGLLEAGAAGARR